MSGELSRGRMKRRERAHQIRTTGTYTQQDKYLCAVDGPTAKPHKKPHKKSRLRIDGRYLLTQLKYLRVLHFFYFFPDLVFDLRRQLRIIV
jgi:hypothetical protein